MGGNEASALDEGRLWPVAHKGDKEEEAGEVLSGYSDEAEEGDRDVPGVEGGGCDEC